KEQLHKCIAAIDAAKQRQRRRFIYSALAAAALIVAALGGSYILRSSRIIPSPTNNILPEKSVAVLPFANLIDESDSAYFVDGIRAQIAARLAKIPNLRIVSGNATQRYQSTPENPTQVAADLGVTDIMQ